MKIKILVFLGLILMVVYSCSSTKNKKQKKELTEAVQDSIQLDLKSGPPTIVYKTTKDYSEYVPVTLSEDKKTITIFPHPKDLFHKGELALPTALSDGYLLDNRGIDTNIAFINIKYKEYSQLKTPPKPDSLLTLILDDKPILEFYNCGSRYVFKDAVEALNRMIEADQLKECDCLLPGKD